VKDPSSRLKLEEYDYEVVYKRGSENRNADAHRRIHVTTPVSEDEDNKPRVSQGRSRIFREMHENPTGGHVRINRTYERIKLFVHWPGMKTEDYVRRYEICHKNKITQNEAKMALQNMTTPVVVWDVL
jgi:hypothetical protein